MDMDMDLAKKAVLLSVRVENFLYSMKAKGFPLRDGSHVAIDGENVGWLYEDDDHGAFVEAVLTHNGRIFIINVPLRDHEMYKKMLEDAGLSNDEAYRQALREAGLI